MATTNYGTNDALAVKLWAKVLAAEALKATKIRPLIGTRKSAIIHHKTESSKSAGDKVTFGLRMQLTGDGVSEGETLEGNEEALTTYTDAVEINQLRHAVRVASDDTIDAQRVTFNMRAEARDGLRDWFAKRYSVTFFNQVCGYTPQTDSKYYGFNSVNAPSSGRQIWAGTATADEGLGASDIFDLKYVDYAKEAAETADPKIVPTMINGEDMYVMYLHPYQITDLRTNTSTGQWQDIQKAAMQGGKISDNPLFTGALGVYNNVILRRADDVTQGVNSSTGAAISTVRRAVLLGAQAAAFATGRRGGTLDFKWVEETFDYTNEVGIAATTIMGMKKTRFNSTDFGTIVVSTYADAHT